MGCRQFPDPYVLNSKGNVLASLGRWKGDISYISIGGTIRPCSTPSPRSAHVLSGLTSVSFERRAATAQPVCDVQRRGKITCARQLASRRLQASRTEMAPLHPGSMVGPHSILCISATLSSWVTEEFGKKAAMSCAPHTNAVTPVAHAVS